MPTRKTLDLQLIILTAIGGLIITALGLLWPRVAPLPSAANAPPLHLANAHGYGSEGSGPGYEPNAGGNPHQPQDLSLALPPSPPLWDLSLDLGDMVGQTEGWRTLGRQESPGAGTGGKLGRGTLSLGSSQGSPDDRPLGASAMAQDLASLPPPLPSPLPPLAAGVAPPGDQSLSPDTLLNSPEPDDGSPIHSEGVMWGIGLAMVALVGWLAVYVSRLQQQLRHLRRQMSDRQNTVIELNTQLQQVTEASQAHRSIIATLERHLTQTQTELTDSQDQCQSLGTQIANLHNRLQERLNDADYLHLLEEENQVLSHAQQELALLQSELDRQQDKVVALTAERDALSHQLSQMSQKLEVCEVHGNFDRNGHDRNGHDRNGGSDRPPGSSESHDRLIKHTLSIECGKDLSKLPLKEFRQLMQRIVDLQTTPRPHDSRPLNKYGLRDVLSVDEGEYRICYSIQEQTGTTMGKIVILVVDKRNDDTVYNRLRRCFSHRH